MSEIKFIISFLSKHDVFCLSDLAIEWKCILDKKKLTPCPKKPLFSGQLLPFKFNVRGVGGVALPKTEPIKSDWSYYQPGPNHLVHRVVDFTFVFKMQMRTSFYVGSCKRERGIPHNGAKLFTKPNVNV